MTNPDPNPGFHDSEKVDNLLECYECVEGAMLSLPQEFYDSEVAIALCKTRSEIETLIHAIFTSNNILQYEKGGSTAFLLTTPTGPKLLITCS